MPEFKEITDWENKAFNHLQKFLFNKLAENGFRAIIEQKYRLRQKELVALVSGLYQTAANNYSVVINPLEISSEPTYNGVKFSFKVICTQAPANDRITITATMTTQGEPSELIKLFGLGRDSTDLVIKARVPTHVSNAMTKHDLERNYSPGSLFEINHSGETLEVVDAREREILRAYQNVFSGPEIELIIAFFYARKEGQCIAHFSSYNEWLSVAAGGTPQNKKTYRKAIEDLEKIKRDFAYSHGGDTIYINTTVLKTRQIRVNNKKVIEIEWDKRIPVVFGNDSVKHLVLGVRKLFSMAGIKRVDDFHVKLYVYLTNQLTSKRKTKNFTIDTIFYNTGIKESYEKHRHGTRAKQKLTQALNAMSNPVFGALRSWEPLGNDHLKIIGNPSFIKENLFKVGVPQKGITGAVQGSSGAG